ncbi:MAG: phage/plasmid replication protein [Bacteroidota bacterium]|jgi:hypothetical protein
MYDSVNLWLPADQAGCNDISKVIQNLSGITEHTKADGHVYVSGFLKNYRVIISEQGISFKGSLAKYLLTNNFNTLTRAESARALEMMADELCLPIRSASVTRIDFAENFLVDHKPEAYYNFLGECKYYNRQPLAKSLYYSNGLRQIVFYNKLAEGKAKGQRLPDKWYGQNVLRYEMRFKSRLPKQFNKTEINAGSLTDEKFYATIFDRWLAEYEAINKLHSINFNLSDMNSPKDFKKQLELFAIKMIGQERIMQDIENLRHQRAFDKPEYYSRLKKEIKELCKTPDMTATSDLVAELDKKIKAIKNNHR